MTTPKKTPAFIAYTVSGDGRDAYWTRIWTAWAQNHAEGLNIELNALLLDGRIILMPPKTKSKETHHDQPRLRPVLRMAEGTTVINAQDRWWTGLGN